MTLVITAKAAKSGVDKIIAPLVKDPAQLLKAISYSKKLEAAHRLGKMLQDVGLEAVKRMNNPSRLKMIFEYLKKSSDLSNLTLIGSIGSFVMAYFLRKVKAPLPLQQDCTLQYQQNNRQRELTLRNFQVMAAVMVDLQNRFTAQNQTTDQIIVDARALTYYDQKGIEALIQAEKTIDVKKVETAFTNMKKVLEQAVAQHGTTIVSRSQGLENMYSARDMLNTAASSLLISRSRLRDAVEQAERLAQEYQEAGIAQELGHNRLISDAKKSLPKGDRHVGHI